MFSKALAMWALRFFSQQISLVKKILVVSGSWKWIASRPKKGFVEIRKRLLHDTSHSGYWTSFRQNWFGRKFIEGLKLLVCLYGLWGYWVLATIRPEPIRIFPVTDPTSLYFPFWYMHSIIITSFEWLVLFYCWSFFYIVAFFMFWSVKNLFWLKHTSPL